jgi:metacaspase-1
MLLIATPSLIGALLLLMTVAVFVSVKINRSPQAATVALTPVVPVKITEPTEEMKSGTFLSNPNGDPTKSAILFGINVCDPNVYQGDRLQLKGCVNDSKSVLSFLQKKGFGKIWYNEDADCTIANFLRVWKVATKDLKDGDTLVLQMSRHGMSLGMNVLDRKGDEEVEQGEYKGDQAAVMYDGLIVDDCFWRLFLDLPKVKLIFINDSCHSGSQYKVANLDLSGKGKPLPYKKARSVGREYMPSKDNVLDTVQLEREFGKPANKERRFDLISISGCQDWETSADAYLNGKYAGAMTYCLMSALNTSGRKSLSEVAKQVVTDLKEKGFAQNPKIIVEGDQNLLLKPLF